MPLTLPRLVLATLHLTAAHGIGVRTSATHSGGPGAALASLPALVLAGFAFGIAAPLVSWSWLPQALFAGGAMLAVYAILSLGRAFAILPSRRGIVVHGPYRWVRHPAYAGELLMFAACTLSQPTPLATAVLGLALPLVALRIRAEERLLSEDPHYQHYRRHVPHRLFPGLW